MSLKNPRLGPVARCAYRPVVGELAPDASGSAQCPVCGAWMHVTKRGTLRPHLDYRGPRQPASGSNAGDR